MKKLDLKKSMKVLYGPSSKAASIIEVPAMNFIMIDGAGDPNTAPAYSEALQALYSAAYTLKFSVKKELAVDYPVLAPEGLWWTDDMRTFSAQAKDDWKWTMMIMTPDVVTRALFKEAVGQAMKKKDLAALEKLRLERFDEGLCAQIMHVGPYAAEAPTIQRLHQFIAESGGKLRGKHHEIYLSDPRRAAPEKLRTVVRQPFAR